MNRTVISLPPELHIRIRRLAEERGISMAELIRQALKEELVRETPKERPKPRFGTFDSGHSDISQRIGEERPEYRHWR